MRHIKNLLLLCTLFVAIKANAQVESNTTEQQKTITLQQQLRLSDSQCTSIKSVYAQLKQNRDSINNLNLTPENRGIFLSEIRAKYDRALQSILTVEQWKIYNDKQRSMQQVFEQHMKKQKAKYTLLNKQ